MSRVESAIDEKICSFFAQPVNEPFLPVDIDSDFISKQVPGIRSCTKRLSRFYRLGHEDCGLGSREQGSAPSENGPKARPVRSGRRSAPSPLGLKNIILDFLYVCNYNVLTSNNKGEI